MSTTSDAPRPALDAVRGTFRAVVQTVVPEAHALPPDEWRALETIVEGALAERPSRLRRQLVLLVRLIELAPVLRYGRGFTALDPAHRTTVLSALQGAPLLLLRRGVSCLELDRDRETPEVLERVAALTSEGRPVVVDVAIDYSHKTFFTSGVIRTNLGRLPWRDRLRFLARAAGRRILA